VIDVKVAHTRSIISGYETWTLQVINDGQIMAALPLDQAGYASLMTSVGNRTMTNPTPSRFVETVKAPPRAVPADELISEPVRPRARPRTLGEAIGIPVEDNDAAGEEATTPFEPQEA